MGTRKEPRAAPLPGELDGCSLADSSHASRLVAPRSSSGPKYTCIASDEAPFTFPEALPLTSRRFDSTLTRVEPVLDRISCTGTPWLERLLGLAEHGHEAAHVRAGTNLQAIEQFWGRTERGLSPPVSLLSWLIRHMPLEPPENDSSTTAAERRLLRAGDPEAIQRALRLLRSSPSPRGWHILEGATYPDALVLTPDAIVVIEGKRTEAGPTTSTSWMPGRHQMLRHLDAAWELRGRRAVYGFFIVEAAPGTVEVPAAWATAARETVSAEAIRSSLPHRPEEEREAIARAFLGVTTWQAVCAEFGVDWALLPDEVDPSAVVPLRDDSRGEETDNYDTQEALSETDLAAANAGEGPAAPAASRMARLSRRALDAAGELTESGKSRLRSTQGALGSAARASGDFSKQAIEKGKALSSEGLVRASAAASDAWTEVSEAGAAAVSTVTSAPVALLERLLKECTVPAYLLPSGSGPEDFHCTFDFRAAVERLESGRLVRPRIQVWAGRPDVDKGRLAHVLHSRFSEELAAERSRRLAERGRGYAIEVEHLRKQREAAGTGIEAAGSVFVASALTMFFVANPFFSGLFLTLAVFTGTAGLSHAFHFVRSALRLSAGSAAAERERKEMESLLDSKNEAFQRAVKNMVIHVHPLLQAITTDLCELDGRPLPVISSPKEEGAPRVEAFLTDSDYRSKLAPWYATLVSAHLGTL